MFSKMKRNTTYKNELFTAERMLNAFIVKTEDHEIAVVIGLSEEIYQYDEEGLISHCVTSLEHLVNLYPKIYKIEIINAEEKTLVFVSLNDGVSNEEADIVATAFDGVVMEPINEEVIEGIVKTHLEIVTESMNSYFKVKKE